MTPPAADPLEVLRLAAQRALDEPHAPDERPLPVRTRVFLALGDARRSTDLIARHADCRPAEALFHLESLEGTGVARDGDGLWAMTDRGRGVRAMFLEDH